MEKLYSYFISFFLMLLCSAGVAHGMELTIPQQKVSVVTQLTEVPSLKQQCLNYIGQDAEQVNLIDNFVCLPSDLAVETLSCADDMYVEQHKIKLIELAQSNQLDIDVACYIAQKFNDISLAHELAKRGPITGGIVEVIVENFLNTDITTCLTDFDVTFSKAFSKEILENDNYGRLYQALINKISFVSFDWTTDRWGEGNHPLSVQDFEQIPSREEIVNYAAKKRFINESFDKACVDGLVALSSCKKFLAFSEKQKNSDSLNLVEIHNLKDRNKISFETCSFGNSFINKLAFSPNSSHLGFLDGYGHIFYIEIASPMTSMLFKNVPLQKIASLVYCYTQSRIKCCDLMLQDIILENTMSHKEEMLMEFIQNNILAGSESFPVCISKKLHIWTLDFKEASILINAFESASKTLGMTKKELLTMWLVDKDSEFIKIINSLIDSMPIDCEEALSNFAFEIITMLTD